MADRGDAREPLQIGETVSVNDLIWERIESLAQDARREEEMQSKFTRLHISDATKEVDVVLQLMPLSKEKLLQIVRDGAAVAKDKRKWEIEHIEAALCIIFGGAQYTMSQEDPPLLLGVVRYIVMCTPVVEETVGRSICKR
jgi:hypothetical protein